MLSHHFDLTNGTIISLAHSFFDLRQTIPDDTRLQHVISTPNRNVSERSPPPPASTALRLAQLLDGGGLTGDTRHWHNTFDLFLLNAFGKLPSPHEITPPDLDRLHTTTCLEIMSEKLHFNMCKLPSSFLRNKDVSDLKALASSNISPHLRYASRNWTRCVLRMKILDSELLQMLYEFFHAHLLYWLEVMAILGRLPVETLGGLIAGQVSKSIIIHSPI